MSFRARLTLVAALAVAVAVVVASAVTYAVVQRELRGQIDDFLQARAEQISQIPHLSERVSFTGQPGKFFLLIPDPVLGGAPGYVQLVGDHGQVALPPSEKVPLPVTPRVREVAAGREAPFLTDARVAGVRLRLLTVPLRPGVALQVARPLAEVDRAMHRISLLLILVALSGIGVAAALGLLVARAALAPVRRLTDATEHVAETRDLRSRIDERGHDELSRLAGSFNTMLEALEDAARARRQLVADASHELRTPLTSLRTNIEVLARDSSMAPADREALMKDLVDQLGEMTALVAELVELARGDQQPLAAEEVRLDLLVKGAVERARRNSPGVRFRTELDESVVHGVPATLDRAVSNLLDNAAKWSPAGQDVDVAVRDGQVVVRDYGPGIDDADLPHVFDRFYRAPGARRLPGSGLGLAIVRQVAESHGGEVVAEQAEGGGTRMRLRLGSNGS